MGQIERPRVLLVEDDPAFASLYHDHLQNEPIELEHVDSGKIALARLSEAPPAVLLLDLNLPDMDGRRILNHIISTKIPTTVLVISGHGSIDIAVETIQAGATDFIAKPFKAERLRITLRNALARWRLTLRNQYKSSPTTDGFEGFVGNSAPMHAVYRLIERAAPSKASVFISGESGSGKEVCAQAIHQHGPRRNRPFIAVNCGAIPKELMESELFGHTKGAFTGAVSERAGAIRQADGGTLLLDEICEMDPALQVKLLRVIQNSMVQKVGSDKPEKVDVRLICATNRDPLAEIAAGRFREDLYYRLHVIPIKLPALSERREDIPPIARHYLSLYAQEEGKALAAFDPGAEAALASYDWPGNIRQLQNVIRNIVVMHDGEVVQRSMLPLPLITAPQASTALGTVWDHAVRPLRQAEMELIETAITRCGGNVVKAAELLEVSPSTLYRKRLSTNENTAA